MNGCKYCNLKEIGMGDIWTKETVGIVAINDKKELVVSIKGEQMNIPIEFCPWCGNKL